MSLIKFFLLAVFTVFLTVVVFRYVRTSPNHEIVTPIAVLVGIDDSQKNLFDSRQNFNDHLYQVWVKDLLIIGASKTGLAIYLSLLHSAQ